MDLNQYILNYIARPLGMSDTMFLLSPEQDSRLAQPQSKPDAAPPGVDRAVTSLRPRLQLRTHYRSLLRNLVYQPLQ